MADRGFDTLDILHCIGLMLNVLPKLSNSFGQLSEDDWVKTLGIVSVYVYTHGNRINPKHHAQCSQSNIFVYVVLTTFYSTLVE